MPREAPERAPPSGRFRPCESATRDPDWPLAQLLAAGFDNLSVDDVVGAYGVELGELTHPRRLDRGPLVGGDQRLIVHWPSLDRLGKALRSCRLYRLRS